MSLPVLLVSYSVPCHCNTIGLIVALTNPWGLSLPHKLMVQLARSILATLLRRAAVRLLYTIGRATKGAQHGRTWYVSHSFGMMNKTIAAASRFF